MSTAYRKLFSIGISHSYYTDGDGRGDFSIRPTADTVKALRDHHMRFIDNDTGLSLMYRYDENGEAFIPDSMISANLRLRFVMELKNEFFFNITDLDITKPLRSSVYYFDASLVTAVGPLPDLTLTFDPPVELDFRKGAFTHTYTLTANPPIGTLQVIGPDGSIVQTYTSALDENNEYKAHVEMSRLRPGRYSLQKLHNGVPQDSPEAFYFDTHMNPAATFGVIEFSKGTEWGSLFNYNALEWADAHAPVPTAPNYADMEYVVEFDHREELWIYKVVFKKTAVPVDLALVTIDETWAAIENNRYHDDQSTDMFYFESNLATTDFDGYELLRFETVAGILNLEPKHPIYQETKKNLNLRIDGDTVYGGLPNPDYKNFKNEVIIYV